ncbi:choice-of-anchor M domain-containing protein [Streptomyces umbrinus]|uniref:choice-of-anchor M domain-containing protein n=1 Tax=Streptomyces umbrinus TaxID=67370 RepID=UPI0034201007
MLEGPGELRVYLTDTLGKPKVYVDSADGFDASDSFALPPEAHTHVNWAFSEPGTYQLTVEGRTETLAGKSKEIGSGTFTFTVGGAAEPPAGATVLDGGHADVALNAETGKVYVRADDEKSGARTRRPAEEVVLNVPDRAKESVPKGQAYDFLGEAGDDVWVPLQAVIGKHVHGDMDPHAWEDVANAEADRGRADQGRPGREGDVREERRGVSQDARAIWRRRTAWRSRASSCRCPAGSRARPRSRNSETPSARRRSRPCS